MFCLRLSWLAICRKHMKQFKVFYLPSVSSFFLLWSFPLSLHSLLGQCLHSTILSLDNMYSRIHPGQLPLPTKLINTWLIHGTILKGQRLDFTHVWPTPGTQWVLVKHYRLIQTCFNCIINHLKNKCAKHYHFKIISDITELFSNDLGVQSYTAWGQEDTSGVETRDPLSKWVKEPNHVGGLEFYLSG